MGLVVVWAMMKTHSCPLLVAILAISMSGCASFAGKPPCKKSASLGQTKGQTIRELGSPTARYMNGFDLFHDEGNEVQAHFQRGKADALFYYTLNKKVSEQWLTSVLTLNSKGSPWVLEASSSSGRKVYRTTDAKYHALLSQGNQLLVASDAFFRAALHQPGKTILIDDLPTCLFAPDHREAKIGDSEALIAKGYGQSVDSAPDGAKEYRNGYQDIMVHYKAGRADAVLYTADKHGRINDTWISCLLAFNSNGNAWIVAEKSKPSWMIWWTPKADLVAQMRKRRSLFVYTKNYGKTLLGQSKKGKENPYFKANVTPCAMLWLGEKESDMTKKCGTPSREGSARIYHDHGVRIRATFDHGVCNRIIYLSETKKRFTDHWITATLAVNSKGRAWFLYEGSTPKKSFFRTYDHKLYARLKDGCNLGILTEAACGRKNPKH